MSSSSLPHRDDFAAWTKLHAEIESRVFKRVGNREIASDTASFVISEVLQPEVYLDAKGEPVGKGFLFGMARLVALKIVRGKSNDLKRLRKYAKESEHLEKSLVLKGFDLNDPSETVIMREIIARRAMLFGQLLEVLDGLEPDARVILRMHYLDNLTYSQIANHICVSEGATRGRALKARKSLREALEAKGLIDDLREVFQ